MEISDLHKKIIKAKACPYCGSGVRKTTEYEVYGKVYKNRVIFCCDNYPECDAYVGSYSDGNPLGRLANKDLRLAKINAHFYFDKIWRSGVITRTKLYNELSIYLGIPKKYTHIGMFKKETCKIVQEWAYNIYIQIK